MSKYNEELRDKFAGQVLAGLYASIGQSLLSDIPKNSTDKAKEALDGLSQIAYAQSDSMMKMRYQ